MHHSQDEQPDAGDTGSGSPGVLLDVDGTLVDSNYLHTIAWSRALRARGEWAPMSAIHRLVGMGGDQLVKQLLDRDDDELPGLWRENYEALMDEVRPFPGATDLLRALRDAGLRVVLASSSPADHVKRMVELLDAGAVIHGTTSADDAATSKPAPDIFDAALGVGGIDRRRALVIGDSIWDIQAARAAGMATVGVEAGGYSRHELMEEGAARVHRDVQELVRQWRTGPLGNLIS
jgi:HAD superfamily hydrolase (TIGR01509 family)